MDFLVYVLVCVMVFFISRLIFHYVCTRQHLNYDDQCIYNVLSTFIILLWPIGVPLFILILLAAYIVCYLDSLSERLICKITKRN